MSLPSSMADFVPCDRQLQKAYCPESVGYVSRKWELFVRSYLPVGRIVRIPIEVIAIPAVCSDLKAD